MPLMNWSGLQCPFTWEECTDIFENRQLLEKLKFKYSCKACGTWETFSFKVLLGCIFGHNKRTSEAFTEFNTCEKYIIKPTNKTFVEDIKEGLKYLISASASHIEFDEKKKKQISTTSTTFEELSKESQAAVIATKAIILCELGHYEKALEHVKVVIEVDPDSNGMRKGAWYHLAGNIYAQKRRSNSNTLPSQDELKMFERSVKNDTRPEYLVDLADLYRETGRTYFDKKNTGMSDKMSVEALKMYRNVLKSKDLNVEVLIRCSAGILKLPKKARIVRVAEDALKMAANISPEESNVYLHLGNLEIFHKNNPKGAVDYYKKSHGLGNDYGTMNMIKFQCKISKTYNPLDDCDTCMAEITQIKGSKSQQKVAVLLAIQGEYYQHVKNDMVSAAKKWNEAIQTASNCRQILNESSIYSKDMTLCAVINKNLSKAVTLKKYSEKDVECFKECLKTCEKKNW